MSGRVVLVAAALVLGLSSCGSPFPDLEDLRISRDAGAGSENVSPPALECGVHEATFPGPVCVSRSRSFLAVRFTTELPAAGSVWCHGPGHSARTSEPGESVEHHLVLGGLAPALTYTCLYGITSGPAGGTLPWSVTVDPVQPSAGPVITEVLIDPEGSEPAQEFVEILNPGASSLDIGGFRLSDVDPTGGEVGDPLPAGTILSPGEVALLVPEGFAPGGPDPAPAEGVLLVRLDGSLARSGLRNSSGEPVFLADPSGLVVSLYPNALGSTAQGMSAQRRWIEAPDGDVANWEEALPTPGVFDASSAE
jgi:hypothetical protein